MKKIMSIVGARPNFIKLAAVAPYLNNEINHVILHTGQHYDNEMSNIFFDQLNIPKPKYNLKVGSSSHSKMTGEILIKGEKIIIKEKPDMVLIYGDINSALAASLICAKLNIPVGHIESGMRSYDRRMPEEANRVLVDHISSLLFCPSEKAVSNLKKEGISKGVYLTGDTTYDIFLKMKTNELLLTKLGLLSQKYYFSTIHRQENTDNPKRLSNLLKVLDSLKMPVVIPIHPRTRNVLEKLDLKLKNIKIIKPISMQDNITLQKYSKIVLTDSGGVQKEAYWLKVPCLTLRTTTEWPETTKMGWNKLVGQDFGKIPSLINSFKEPSNHPQIYGDGMSGQKIAKIIKEWVSKN